MAQIGASTLIHHLKKCNLTDQELMQKRKRQKKRENEPPTKKNFKSKKVSRGRAMQTNWAWKMKLEAPVAPKN